MIPVALDNARGRGELKVHWQDGLSQTFSHAGLRARCPCSRCRAARLGGRIELVSDSVRLIALNPQGYGVQLVFDDGHDLGIFPWHYLRELTH
ncbi:gamma-butyrobetaine hydroxylase-like domain-containing protein [Pseudomonas sp. R5(2019)]|uniref:DUF971 domain-containing protein n=1 Tax=Pseudomonas sp. R5(2019) TaxID=2697566 RepID=UPI0014120D43|nr:gamma-butyrobetaine hydroxylase-like domain-containing protein [Pseudomonas sp. R5(2019)]NBA97368.1 DUF971 domain-containing protein [Pseudomonas sp. R5(2019)]